MSPDHKQKLNKLLLDRFRQGKTAEVEKAFAEYLKLACKEDHLVVAHLPKDEQERIQRYYHQLFRSTKQNTELLGVVCGIPMYAADFEQRPDLIIDVREIFYGRYKNSVLRFHVGWPEDELCQT